MFQEWNTTPELGLFTAPDICCSCCLERLPHFPSSLASVLIPEHLLVRLESASPMAHEAHWTYKLHLVISVFPAAIQDPEPSLL